MTRTRARVSDDRRVPKHVFGAKARIRLFFNKGNGRSQAEQLLLVGFQTRLKKLLRSTDINERGMQEIVENPVKNPNHPFLCPFKVDAVP